MLLLKVGKKNVGGTATRWEGMNADDKRKTDREAASGPHSPLQSCANIPRFSGMQVKV